MFFCDSGYLTLLGDYTQFFFFGGGGEEPFISDNILKSYHYSCRILNSNKRLRKKNYFIKMLTEILKLTILGQLPPYLCKDTNVITSEHKMQHACLRRSYIILQIKKKNPEKIALKNPNKTKKLLVASLEAKWDAATGVFSVLLTI